MWWVDRDPLALEMAQSWRGTYGDRLTLVPGTYTLRMLLADQKHLPHFVFS